MRSTLTESAAACRTALLLGGLTFGLLACSPTVNQHGHRIDVERLAQIQPGQTQKAEVAGLLGSPSTSGTFDDDTWYYVRRLTERYSFYQEDVAEQEVVAITFDDADRVQAVRRLDLADARNIDPVDEETPTAGNDYTLLQQLVGNLGRFNQSAGGGDSDILTSGRGRDLPGSDF